jgi:hypothetical protein
MEFERRIMVSEANNAKFNFLGTADPYHAYYRMRVRQQREQQLNVQYVLQQQQQHQQQV